MKSTFKNLPKWVKKLRENVKEPLSILLVGNKKDLGDLRKVNQQEAIDFAKIINAQYIETSAKTGENVVDTFEALTMVMITYFKPEFSEELKTFKKL